MTLEFKGKMTKKTQIISTNQFGSVNKYEH